MGRVHNQTVNEGRGCQEFYSVSLSEVEVIKKLIQFRSKFDEMYELKLYYDPNPYVSNDVRVFREPVEVVYIDLENLINKTRLSDHQRMIIDLLMKGYTCKDISELKDISIDTVGNSFEIACRKIKEQNDYDWGQFIETSGYYKIPSDARYKKCSKCGEFKRLNGENFRIQRDCKDGFRPICKSCEASAKKVLKNI